MMRYLHIIHGEHVCYFNMNHFDSFKSFEEVHTWSTFILKISLSYDIAFFWRSSFFYFLKIVSCHKYIFSF